MAGQYQGVRIYAVFRGNDVVDYLESLAEGSGAVDRGATLDACERGIEEALRAVYSGARIAVRRQDGPAHGPSRTRVESDDSNVDPDLLGQEIDDLIAEFDITECVVYRD